MTNKPIISDLITAQQCDSDVEPEVIAYLRADIHGVPEFGEDCVSQRPDFPNYDGDESVSMPMIRQADHHARINSMMANLGHAASLERLSIDWGGECVRADRFGIYVTYNNAAQVQHEADRQSADRQKYAESTLKACMMIGRLSVLLREAQDEVNSTLARRIQVELADLQKGALPAMHKPVTASSIREAMENAAAKGKPSTLTIGSTDLRVTYHGVKWYHSLLTAEGATDLIIDEFDEILNAALSGAAS